MASAEQGAKGGKQAEKRQKMEKQQRTQRQASTPLDLALLFVVAVTSFVVLGTAIARREVHAARWVGLDDAAVAASTPAGATAAPLTMLARGAALRAVLGARMLGHGDVSAAAVAMDGAMRAARVAAFAAPPPARAAFDSMRATIERARERRQDGDFAGAASALARAAQLAANVGSSGVMTAFADGAAYDGARLINANGEIIGVVDHVRAEAGSAATATVIVGGYHHVLGFMDFGGTRLELPIERLAFGESKTIGAVDVAVASFATTADQLQATAR